MKKELFITSLVLLTAISPISQAKAFDVNPDENHHVRVTRTGENVKFEECFRGNVPECVRPIGRASGYEERELRSQRSIEILQGFGALTADVAVIMGLAVGVAVISSSMVGSGVSLAAAESASTGAMIQGYFGGTAAAAPVISLVSWLNPVEQFKQASAISDDVLTDRHVRVKDLSRFIGRLELVLEKIGN